MLTRTYPVRPTQESTPKPLSQLIAPVVSPTVSEDDKTSGCASDREHDAAERGRGKSQRGLIASIFDAHCILLGGNPERRLNSKICKRRCVKLAKLLDTDELYSSGPLVKPSFADWANAQLCTFRRGLIFRLVIPADAILIASDPV